MAKIVPLRGYRYDIAQVGSVERVVAPPYDTISAAQEKKLHQLHPENVVHLTLPGSKRVASKEEARYQAAADQFKRMKASGVLIQDETPSIYLYDQTYQLNGETCRRQGFIALARIEDFASGMIKPHEKTQPRAKADRFELLRACEANFSPIFALYSDPCCAFEAVCGRLRKEEPVLSVTEKDGVLHQVWPVDDPALIRRAQTVLDDKPLFIANGHHRYEAARAYRDLCRASCAQSTGQEPYNYVMMFLANMEDQGMRVLPTHRLVEDSTLQLASLLEGLQDSFELEITPFSGGKAARYEAMSRLQQWATEEQHAFLLYAGDGKAYFFRLKSSEVLADLFPAKTPAALQELDVSLLHRLVLEEQLGIASETTKNDDRLHFIHDTDRAFELVEEAEGRFAFLMNPTPLTAIRDVANSGAKMPRKSTHFYPKLLSGLVIRSLEDGCS